MYTVFLKSLLGKITCMPIKHKTPSEKVNLVDLIVDSFPEKDRQVEKTKINILLTNYNGLGGFALAILTRAQLFNQYGHYFKELRDHYYTNLKHIPQDQRKEVTYARPLLTKFFLQQCYTDLSINQKVTYG